MSLPSWALPFNTAQNSEKSSIFCYNLFQEQTNSQTCGLIGSLSLRLFLATKPITVLCSPRQTSNNLAFYIQRIRHLSSSLSKIKEMVRLSLCIYLDCHPNQAKLLFMSSNHANVLKKLMMPSPFPPSLPPLPHILQLLILRPFKE